MTTITPLLRVKERIVGPSGYFGITTSGMATPTSSSTRLAWLADGFWRGLLPA
jgi:hypothetical protein